MERFYVVALDRQGRILESCYCKDDKAVEAYTFTVWSSCEGFDRCVVYRRYATTSVDDAEINQA